jgi:ABC-2 type transport system permease protein
MSATNPAARAEQLATEPLRLVGARQGFFRGSLSSLADIWERRELLGLLTKRELTAKYKDSSLGIVWSLIRPLAQLLIYYFVIGELLQVARGIPDFAIFIFIGLTSWTLFADILSLTTTSIIGNTGIVKKVYLPREIFPLSTVGSALFSFAVQFVILLAATIVLGAVPFSTDLVYAPLALLVIIVFGTAVGLTLAAANVYFRDFQHIVEVVVVVLFWASPIVYSFTFVHRALVDNAWLQEIYLANPITIAIIGMQKALWVSGSTGTGDFQQIWPDNLLIRLLITLAISLVLLWLSQRLFSRLQRDFAQEL